MQIINEDSFLKINELMSKIFLKEYKRLSSVMAVGLYTHFLVFPCITPCGNCYMFLLAVRKGKKNTFIFL